MTTIEGNPISREIASFDPSNPELMAGFVIGVNGPIPTDETNLAKGLIVASQEADFLGRFVDNETGQITPEATDALCDLETKGLLKKKDGNWVIPAVENKLDTPSNQLNSKVRSIFKPAGIEILKSAGAAANDAWWRLGA